MWLRPDAKAQVTVRYRDEQPVAVDTVVISTQLQGKSRMRTSRREVITRLIEPVVPGLAVPVSATWSIRPGDSNRRPH